MAFSKDGSNKTAIVRANDDLWTFANRENEPDIVHAMTYNAGKSYDTTEKRVARIIALNRLVGATANDVTLVLGQSLYYLKKKAPAKATSNVRVISFGFKLDPNTHQKTSQLYVSWVWDKTVKNKENGATDHFEYIRQYSDGEVDEKTQKVIWKEYDKGNISDPTAREYLWETPFTSTHLYLRIKIKAVSKKNSKKKAYWTSGWSTVKVTAIGESAVPPEQPSEPSVSLDKLKLEAKYDNLPEKCVLVEWEVVKNELEVIHNATTDVTTRHSSMSINVDTAGVYKVRARISIDGFLWSEWSDYTESAQTLPGITESGLSVSVIDINRVRLFWKKIDSADTYDIEWGDDPDLFGVSDSGRVITGIEGTERVITGIDSGKRYYFRVRGVNEGGASDWSENVSCILGTEPDKPTTWSLSTVVDLGDDIVFYWVHNTEDGSKETEANIRLTINGVEQELINVPNTRPENSKETISSYVYSTESLESGTEIKWEVQTAGVYTKTNEADPTVEERIFSDWSITRTINVYGAATASVYITNAGDNNASTEISQLPATIHASADQGSVQPLFYEFKITPNEPYEIINELGDRRIISTNDAIYRNTVESNQNSVTFPIGPENVTLENNMEYTLYVKANMASGSYAEAEYIFTTAWDEEEFDINADISINFDSLSAMINPYCYDAEGELADAMLSVYRRELDGTLTEIAKDIENSLYIYVTDPHPSLDYARYRIIAKARETGSMNYVDLLGQEIGEGALVLQWDETTTVIESDDNEAPKEDGWSGSMVKLPYNIGVSNGYDPDKATVKYAGRRNPVSYYGTQIGQSLNLSCVLIRDDDTDTLNALKRLSVYMGDVYVREPSGTGFWATLDISFSRSFDDPTIPVTIQATRVEGGK